MQLVLTPQLVIEAYKQGLFPMAYSRHSSYLHWVCPEKRGQLPIGDFHIPRRLRKTLRQGPFEIKINTAFEDVIHSCAQNHPTRPETWINDDIINVFCKLHKTGFAHSIEAFDTQGSGLVGGLYGLALGGAFFGESMFSRARDASKVVLAHTAARLLAGGFVLFDTQFINDHLRQFGAYEISHESYMKTLHQALDIKSDFYLSGKSETALLENLIEHNRIYKS